jgi:hypothetical protein
MVRPQKPLSVRLQKMERLYKPWAVYWIKPGSIALGNSRFYYSLSMEHPGWRHARRYNLSMTGATTDELAELLQHAVNSGPVDQLVLALDGVCDEGVAPQLAPYRLLESPGTHPGHGLWLARDLLSQEVLSHAVEDLFLPTRNSFDSGRALVFDEYEYRSRGQGFVTQQREARTVRDLLGKPKQCSHNALERLLDLAYSHGLDTTIVVNPYHVRLMRVEERLGGGPPVAPYALIATNARLAQQYGRAPFPIWFFATVNSITTDPLAAPGGSRSAESPYWYEPSHYRKIVGDWILDRAFGVTAAGPPPPSDFGVLLTGANVDAVLAQRAEGYDAWVQQHPQAVAEVDHTVEEALGRR